MRCVEAGIMQGYPDGSIRPEGNLTRAEVMALLYRMDKLKL
jgi:N-acetylmuramoyl-L-alanine amidase